MKTCKHKFRPRYNRKWSTTVKDVVDGPMVFEHFKTSYDKPYLQEETYIYDICVKCGEIKNG